MRKHALLNRLTTHWSWIAIPIPDFAANIGLGMPLGGTFTNINIGLEIGKRGTKYYNLVEENYINLSVGLSLSDKWFVKRKFD